MPSNERILWNHRPTSPSDGGDIDEIVMDNVMVHIEQMTDRCWWIALYRADDMDTYWMGNFVADSRGRMRFVEQENAGIEWPVDQSHAAGEVLHTRAAHGFGGAGDD